MNNALTTTSLSSTTYCLGTANQHAWRCPATTREARRLGHRGDLDAKCEGK